jgi:hypothetical protein
MPRHAVIVSTPSQARGQVALLVATRTGAVLLTPEEGRALAGELLVAADHAAGVPLPSAVHRLLLAASYLLSSDELTHELATAVHRTLAVVPPQSVPPEAAAEVSQCRELARRLCAALAPGETH